MQAALGATLIRLGLDLKKTFDKQMVFTIRPACETL